jgi:rubrerythrin
MEVQPLTQKEILYLEDAKRHEEMCIAKYGTYAEQLQDPHLKALFLDIKRNEQQHLATIEALLKNGGAKTTRLS